MSSPAISGTPHKLLIAIREYRAMTLWANIAIMSKCVNISSRPFRRTCELRRSGDYKKLEIAGAAVCRIPNPHCPHLNIKTDCPHILLLNDPSNGDDWPLQDNRCCFACCDRDIRRGNDGLPEHRRPYQRLYVERHCWLRITR